MAELAELERELARVQRVAEAYRGTELFAAKQRLAEIAQMRLELARARQAPAAE